MCTYVKHPKKTLFWFQNTNTIYPLNPHTSQEKHTLNPFAKQTTVIFINNNSFTYTEVDHKHTIKW